MLPIRIPDFLFRQIREQEERADRVHEVVIGIVTDNKDPNKLGRIKVKFPTLPNSDQDTSWWAPIASLGGGKERGWWFLPEVDDEVLVAFECGDIRKPVILGALWNGVDVPPESNSGSNPKRLIVSREDSRIIFDDDEGTVTLQDGAGIGKVIISKDNKITIEAMEGDVGVYAPTGCITIVANEVQMDGSSNAKLEPGGEVKIGSDAGATLKGGTMVQCQGSKIQLNPGGVSAPEAATLEAEEVPDPLTERISQVEPGAPEEASEEGGGGGGGGGEEGSEEEQGEEEQGEEEQGEEGNPIPEEAAAEEEPTPPAAEHFVEVRIVDPDGKPVAGVALTLIKPDGSRAEATTDDDGVARWESLTDGTARVVFPDDPDHTFQEGS